MTDLSGIARDQVDAVAAPDLIAATMMGVADHDSEVRHHSPEG